MAKSATQLRLDEETHAKAKYIAEKELRSLNAQLEYFIITGIKSYEEKHGVIHLEEK